LRSPISTFSTIAFVFEIDVPPIFSTVRFILLYS
jgi:hypothetical protein